VDLLLEFHPEAAAEAAAARVWYGERSLKASAAFLAELDVACERISEAPNRYPTHVAGTRRYLMRRFPFHIVYRVPSGTDAAIQIIAVAHGHRRPGYWRDRST
jgi:plasmid stabilization system protein ParE